MSEVLTIGAFLHDLNLPSLKKQSSAYNLLKSEIDKLFMPNRQLPNLKEIFSKYGMERFISKVVSDGLEYYYDKFRKHIQNEYSVEFAEIIQGKYRICIRTKIQF
jgi:hypothetical protein